MLSVLEVQHIPRNMHTVFALLCFAVVIHWLIFPYPTGLLHWHCGNLTIAPVPAKQPWWIWINTSCEFIMNDCITTTKQSTTKPCAYFLGYTVYTEMEKSSGWLPQSLMKTLKTSFNISSDDQSSHPDCVKPSLTMVITFHRDQIFKWSLRLVIQQASKGSVFILLVCDLNRTPNCYGKTWRLLCPFFRNLHLRENLARDCFTFTASTVTNSAQNSFTRLRYCDK